MAHDARDILNSCRDMFNKQENCPFRFLPPDHPGFSELTRVQTVPFHEDPARLWTSSLTVGWVARQGKDMKHSWTSGHLLCSGYSVQTNERIRNHSCGSSLDCPSV